MSTTAQLTELQRHKHALLAQSELYRGMLQLEYARLEHNLAWVDGGLRLVKSFSPWLALAAPLAGYFLARKRSGRRGLWLKGWAAWRLLRRVWPALRTAFEPNRK